MSSMSSQRRSCWERRPQLANVDAIGAASAAAVGPTTEVLPAGADEVSTVIAAVFGKHAQEYHALRRYGDVVSKQFVQLMKAAAEQYTLAEAAAPLTGRGTGFSRSSTHPLRRWWKPR